MGSLCGQGSCSSAFRTLLSPYLGGIALHVPALGKPILPISLPSKPQTTRVPRPADLHPKIAVDLNALETVLARPIPSPSPSRDIS